MNYFELFEIPVTLTPDKDKLPKKYFELQKKYHPDFYTNATQEEQADVLEKSSLVNKGFKILSDPDETLKYVLQQKNILKDDEKYELSPVFLMEMMDMNEALMDEDEASLEKTTVQIKIFEEQLYNEVKPIFENYHDAQVTEKDLLDLKDYYFKKKYLQRILERIEGMRNIAPL